VRSLLYLTFLICAATPLPTTQAADWPQFRGPHFNGSADETDLPTEWSYDSVKWTAELPGPSAATPAIWGNRIFVSSVDEKTNALSALCIDRTTGEYLWRYDVQKGQPTHRDEYSNFASPSPATDGKAVYFFYGTGHLVSFGMEGNLNWTRNIATKYGEMAFLWTYAASPLLYKDRLYIPVLQRDVPVDGRGFADRKNESYILAIDAATGTTVWRHIRPSLAQKESREAYSTPFPLETATAKALVIVGGDAVTGHDFKTGAELWRWGTWNPERITHWRLVPSPVAAPLDDVVLICAPKRKPVYAIRSDKTGKLGPDAVAWESSKHRTLTSDVPTPAYYDGDFFILSDLRKSLSRVNPKTGDIKWTVKTPGKAKFEASPLVADDKVYLVNFNGHVTIVDAKSGAVLNTVATETLGDHPIRSSVVAAHGHLFLRFNRRLVCVGGSK
jgi:outer membrane protein assembly factor BamB